MAGDDAKSAGAESAAVAASLSALDHAPIPVCIVLDADGSIAYGNHRFHTLFRAPDRAPPSFDALPTNDHDADRLREALRAPAPSGGIEMPIRTGTGGTYDARLTVASFRLQDEPAHAIWLDAARPASLDEQFLAALLQHTPATIALKDPGGRTLRVSESITEQYGITPAQARASTFQEHPHRDDAEAILAHDRQVLRTGNASTQLRPIARPDGSRMFCAVTKFPVRNAQGEAVGIGVVSIDRSDAVLAEREARRQNARFDSYFSNIPIVLSMKDTDGRYLLANRAFGEWVGIDEHALVGLTARDVFDASSADLVENVDRALLRTRIPVTQEIALSTRASKTLQVFEVKFPVVDDDGEVHGIGVAAIDVTALRETERNLRQAQRMESLGHLTGGIAHDFNNVLGIIQGNLDLAAELAGRGEVAVPFLTAALDATERASALTSKLLAFSRQGLEASSPLDPDPVIRDAVTLFARALPGGVTVELDLGGGGWLSDLDPGELESALLNLALNASDAMPDGGTLSIRTRCITLRDEDAGTPGAIVGRDYIVLSVSDTGSGIAPDLAERVFEPLFTTKESGTGLGLAMVYGFVRRSDGFVRLESDPGQGARFSLHLPRSSREPVVAADAAAGSAPSVRGDETVLVVDDEAALLEVAAQALETVGFVVLRASDARSALAQLDAHPETVLLLSDVVMPGGMDGLGLAEEARRRHPALRVVLSSGLSPTAIASLRIEEHRIRLLFKPYRSAELVRCVREEIDR